MSDATLQLRDLPPVEPITPPERFRQSLLNRANGCKRSAYLYAKYGGGRPAIELDFGSAAHFFFERAMSDLIAQGEASLYAPAEGEDPVAAAREVASLTAAMVDEVLREHPELSVPIAHETHSVDHLREIAYHWAIAQDVDPRTVMGLEQMFILDTPSGIPVTGKVDLHLLLRDGVFGVEDYKTGFNVPAQSEFEALLQLKLYALMALVGNPVEVRDGEWVRLPPLGEGVNYVRGRMLYPRLKPDEDGLRKREVLFTRQQLMDWQHDSDGLVEDLAARFGMTDDPDRAWRFPAVAGSWCNECPCKPECPLPAQLRDHAGTVNTRDDAAEALGSVLRSRAGADALMKEVRSWARRNGAVRVGDLEFDWRDTVKHDPIDYEALEQAVYEAAQFGKPFEAGLFIRTRTTQSFTKKKLSPVELAGQQIEEADADGSRFGDAAPF